MAITFTVQPQSSSYYAGEVAADLTALASGDHTIKYYWQFSNDGITWTTAQIEDVLIDNNGEPIITNLNQPITALFIDMSDEARLSIMTTDLGTKYYRAVAVDVVSLETETSDIATIVVIIGTPTIVVQPQNMIVSVRDSKNLIVTASVPLGTLTYQWQVSSDGSDFSNISGATTNPYAVSDTTVGVKYYRAIITNTYGGQTASITSASCWLSIRAEVVKNTTGYIAYVLSAIDLSFKDYFQYETYSFADDIEFSNKSEVHINRQPNISNDDFVICKQGKNTLFFGICENYSSSNESDYTISLKQKECLFDRSIFLNSESLISSTGIEDFIVSAITDNWIDSNDELMDKDYMTATASTHTPLNVTVNADNGTFNLKTFIGNAKEYYGIFVDFEINGTGLDVTVRKDNGANLNIDARTSDVPNYEETYNVDVLARLLVKYRNKTTSTITNLAYYLKADRTITTDKTDPERANGISKSVYIEASTIDEVNQKAVDEFKSNSYEHKISFDLYKDSMAYQTADYYVGRMASIRTKTGIKSNSLITATTKTSDSALVNVVFGKLKVSLIEKLRGK